MSEILEMYGFKGTAEYIFKVSKDYKIISFEGSLKDIFPHLKKGDSFIDVFGFSREDCARLFTEREYDVHAVMHNKIVYSLKTVKTKLNGEDIYIVTMVRIHNYESRMQEAMSNKKRVKDILDKLPVFYARYTVTDTITLMEASNAFFEFYNTTPEDYAGNVFFGSMGFSEKQIAELVEKGKKREPVDFEIKTFKNNDKNDIIYMRVQASCVWEMNGFPVYFAIFIDITEQKNMEFAIQYEKERYKIAVECTNDTIYEYDIKNDNIVVYGWSNKDKNSDRENVLIESYSANIGNGEYVNPDDAAKVMDFLNGRIQQPIEARLRTENEFIWVKITGQTIFSHTGEPIKIIGRIININEEKLKELKELENSYRDKLTGLLKKTRGEQLIKNYLAQKKEDIVCTAFIVDLDNFGEINNNYSFLFGDTILQEIASILISVSGDDAIVTRIGGDEFLVFCKETGRIEAEKTAEKICDEVSEIYTGENEQIKLSCSIGMVSSDIVDYDELVRSAERAAVYVKQNGKCGYKSYYDLPEKDRKNLARMISLQRNLITSESIYSEKDDSIIEFTFDLLEKTRDLRSAIKLLLKRIGKYYDFDRISIIDVDTDFLVCSVSYQWDSIKGGMEKKGPIIRITEEEAENTIQRFSAGNSILFYGDTEYGDTLLDRIFEDKERKNHVMFINAMYEGGKLQGVCIYEDFHNERVWDRNTQGDLREITKIIATHISRENADIASNVKSEFLSRMSHNIRTPMNAITGMTEIARHVIDDKEKTINCLDKIEISTKYLINLINDILDMSSIESGKLEIRNEPFSLDDIIKVVATVTEEKAKKSGIDFHIYMDYSDRYFLGDGVRLNQVLVNIVNNAVKFTDEGGRVDFKICQLPSDEGEAVIRFDIIDTGIGISEENMHRIFKMFEQGDSDRYDRGTGTGIGLAITSNIVKLMGSKLQVESRQGEGSDFWFVLKLKICETEKTDDNERNKEEYNFKGKRILLVEDDELNAEIAQTVLEIAGFEVELAVNGQIAVDMFRNNAAHYYDGILMDIRMPVMNGLDATRNIRILNKEDSRSIPIIALTAEAFTSDERRSLESGMNAHLSKPINAKVLYSVLDNLL